ncbi:MAG: phosphotransferase [Thermodesulfobacteriota bacterium]
MAIEPPGHPALNEAGLRFLDEHWPSSRTDPSASMITPLAGGGSDRAFFRVSAGAETAVLVIGPDREENRAYEAIGRHLWRLGQWGPEFLAADQDLGLFLIEDLGSIALQDLAGRATMAEKERLYRPVVEIMAGLHQRGWNGFDPEWCHQTRRYNKGLILDRETGYFLRAFVSGYLGRTIEAADMAGEFEALADAALAGPERGLMHRDFQSRNVMVKNGRPRLIDFQGARLGPPGYDLASLVYDPYVPIAEDLRDRLTDHYITLRREATPGGFGAESFRRSFPFLATCRLLQALGAFGHLTRVKGKPHFAAYILPAVGNLRRLLAGEGFDFLPRLRNLVSEIELSLGVGN